MQDAPLIHHVFFWLNNPGSKEDQAKLLAGLETLRAIPQIRALHIGVAAPTEDRDVVDSSYGASELMLFGSLEDQAIYQDHPIHLAFIETHKHLWSKVVVYDTAKA